MFIVKALVDECLIILPSGKASLKVGAILEINQGYF
jgi:hypothetical protein